MTDEDNEHLSAIEQSLKLLCQLVDDRCKITPNQGPDGEANTSAVRNNIDVLRTQKEETE